VIAGGYGVARQPQWTWGTPAVERFVRRAPTRIQKESVIMIPAFMPGILVAANRLTGGAVGDFVQNTVTQLTGSEALGQVAGMVTDAKTGNWFGVINRGIDFLDGIEDFQVEAELRWGPGSAQRICGTPGAVAESCPGPKDRISVDFGWDLGFVGWGIKFTVGGGECTEGGAGTKGACPSPSAGMKSILDDPTLSLEAKVAMLFAAMIDDLDDQIEGKLRDMESASQAQQKAKGTGGDSEAAGNDFNKLSTEVQMLMQKRSQMYGLQSNMMSMFNDVSMQIINNVR
jgi:hypothetical protein